MEEFAEGLFRPALQRVTYDPDAVWDDEWLSDTLYDTAVGTVLGTLGGGMDVGTDRTTAVENVTKTVEQSAAKQKNPVSELETGNENTRLTDADMPTYLLVGDRQHVRDLKQGIVRSGDSPILSTPEKVKSFIRNSIIGRTRNTIKAYGRVGGRFQSDVAAKSEGRTDISGYYLELDSNRLQHLSDHIKDDGDPRNIPLTEEQVVSIPDYIDTYDAVLDVVTRKDGQTRICLGKQINGHSVIVVLSSRGRKSVQPVTAWQNTTEHYLKKYGKTQVDTSQNPTLRAGNESGYKPAPSQNSILQAPRNVNEPAALGRAMQSAYNAGRVNVPVTAPELDDPDLEAAYFAGQRERILIGEDAKEDRKPVENVWEQDYTEHEKLNQSLKNVHGLTKTEEDSLVAYKSSESYKINAKLRESLDLDDYQRKIITGMDSALDKLPRYTGTVHRNIGFDDFGGEDAYNAFMREHATGNVVPYRAYTSTSTDRDGYPVDGKYKVHIEITGSGRDIAGYGNNMEKEILYPRNSLFLVTQVETAENGTPIIHMQEVVDD